MRLETDKATNYVVESSIYDMKKKKFKELDVVRVRGTIVHCYGDGKTYEVEIVDGNGETLALFTVSGEELEATP